MSPFLGTHTPSDKPQPLPAAFTPRTVPNHLRCGFPNSWAAPEIKIVSEPNQSRVRHAGVKSNRSRVSDDSFVLEITSLVGTKRPEHDPWRPEALRTHALLPHRREELFVRMLSRRKLRAGIGRACCTGAHSRSVPFPRDTARCDVYLPFRSPPACRR